MTSDTSSQAPVHHSAPPDVHVGCDGWLFLTGGASKVISFYTDPEAFPVARADEWAARLEVRREKCEALGCRYVHVIAPDKLTVYAEYFRDELAFSSACPARQVADRVRRRERRDHLVDLLPVFEESKKKRQLYWKTDTHWCFAGCYTAYRAICERLDVQPNKAMLNAPFRAAEISLDLGVRLSPPPRERFILMDFVANAERVFANEIMNFKEAHGRENDVNLHAGSWVVFRNKSPAAVDMKVLIFGDSFSECRPTLLTGMFAETFREVHFVWSFGVDWAHVEKIKPDLLLTETAERTMATCPTDAFNLERFVASRMAAVTAPKT